jgi:metallo-beta-lactamase class B
MKRVAAFIRPAAALGLLLAHAASGQTPTPTPSSASGLAGTSWRLVRFQGGDEKTLTPSAPAKYTFEFGAGGRLAVRIDCNRGKGTWKSEAPGTLAFGPIAMTRVGCPPAPLNDRLSKDLSFVRSYVLKNGHLFLSLMADGGIYELAPGGAPASGRPTPSPAPSDEMRAWLEPAEPFTIVGPIRFVGTLSLCAYFIPTPAGHILLNGLMPQSAAHLEASIRKLGYKPEDIKILLISHAHIDHVGTLARLQKLSGARVEVMAADVSLLKSGGKTDYLFAKDPRFHFDPVATDRVLKDGDTVELGGVKLTARATPGHTPGTTTWLTTVEDGGRSYSVVFADGMGLNPGTPLVRGPSYPGIADDYRRTFQLLESLHPDIFLSYHSGFFDFAGKRERAKKDGVHAWVDPDGYRRRIAESQADFESLVAKESGAAPAPEKRP